MRCIHHTGICGVAFVARREAVSLVCQVDEETTCASQRGGNDVTLKKFKCIYIFYFMIRCIENGHILLCSFISCHLVQWDWLVDGCFVLV